MSETNFLIGIDLGTTNCTLSYCSLQDKQEPQNFSIEQFYIPQLTKAGLEQELASLPSCIYFPTQEEAKAKKMGISWDESNPLYVGTYAQSRGSELPSRLITSAKSWLSYSGIDRREPCLPLMADEDIKQYSPLQACTELLTYLKSAWDNKMTAPFSEQAIFITVPASFDPSARQLVQEASQKASYPEVILLEEPQAAFYAWMDKHAKDWRDYLKVGDCVLVVDIGGGTTDFSLIEVAQENGNFILKRLAVGAHLLLGGDNIDLGLAVLARNKLEDLGHTIDEWQFQSLIYSARKAKEAFMSESPPQKIDITVLGRGSRLIGGTIKIALTLEEAQKLIIEGFCPLVSPQERSNHEKRSGLQQLGLPYVQDARITCQLAKFLSMTGESNSESMENFVMPSAVLFNGGTTKAVALRHRLVEQLNQWAKMLAKPIIKVLPDADYDFAVSRGAVNYGLARVGKAIRIKSGTSHSYFIGVEESIPAVPGLATPLKALCIVPFGMEEGTELELESQTFNLVLGELATFRFFSHSTPKFSNGTEPTMGTVIRQWKQELTELNAIETLLDKTEGDGKTIRVKISSRLTELGMLELWCKASDERKWKLEFDIRKK